MSISGNVDPGEEKDIPGAGSSTDQHISGAAETGTFTTDKAPPAGTQAHGSSVPESRRLAPPETPRPDRA